MITVRMQHHRTHRSHVDHNSTGASCTSKNGDLSQRRLHLCVHKITDKGVRAMTPPHPHKCAGRFTHVSPKCLFPLYHTLRRARLVGWYREGKDKTTRHYRADHTPLSRTSLSSAQSVATCEDSVALFSFHAFAYVWKLGVDTWTTRNQCRTAGDWQHSETHRFILLDRK